MRLASFGCLSFEVQVVRHERKHASHSTSATISKELSALLYNLQNQTCAASFTDNDAKFACKTHRTSLTRLSSNHHNRPRLRTVTEGTMLMLKESEYLWNVDWESIEDDHERLPKFTLTDFAVHAGSRGDLNDPPIDLTELGKVKDIMITGTVGLHSSFDMNFEQTRKQIKRLDFLGGMVDLSKIDTYTFQWVAPDYAGVKVWVRTPRAWYLLEEPVRSPPTRSLETGRAPTV